MKHDRKKLLALAEEVKPLPKPAEEVSLVRGFGRGFGRSLTDSLAGTEWSCSHPKVSYSPPELERVGVLSISPSSFLCGACVWRDLQYADKRRLRRS